MTLAPAALEERHPPHLDEAPVCGALRYEHGEGCPGNRTGLAGYAAG